MANANSTPIRTPLDRLKVDEYSWGKLYRGSEAEFVAAGLIKPGWFPGKPGNPKTSVRVGMLDGEMKVLPYLAVSESVRKKYTIKIFRSGKSRFEVWVRYSEEEQDRRDLNKRIEKLYAEKKRELDEAPKTTGDFLKSGSWKIKGFMEIVHSMFREDENGFHYAPEVVEEAQELIADLVSLAENGRVCFDPIRQKYFLDYIERKFEKENPEFSAFMKTTLAVGKAALE
ncbi:hypothetical protein SAMN05216404_101232 [Nitrosospira multiformis]|uniref:Uncharacterized protein n=1 Tax=Nitrosospira multiformis TaxID=1231 RepID=A0A1H8BFM2_9PROT|nr:hypothetical protein [Nitrosospira multiformis]SEM81602.1 hypothetical protein SAMN05216404_101232 [Nitrosospira multiformis]